MKYQEWLTPQEFLSKYSFTLTNIQRDELNKAKEMGLKVWVEILDYPFGRYLNFLQASNKGV